jgi:hypothetical protein
LAKAQGGFTFAAKTSEAPTFEKGGNRAGRRTYADLAAVLDAVRKGLAENELAIIQTPFSRQDGGVLLRTTLAHSSGEWIASEISFPVDRMGAIQGWGSALTYARRYALAAMVGIAQDDDDGEAAQAAEKAWQRKPAQQPAPRQAAPTPAAQLQQAVHAATSMPQPKEGELDGARLNALFARLRELGYTEKEDCLTKLSEVLGRKVNSRKDLTVAEFHKFMAATENAPVDQPPF